MNETSSISVLPVTLSLIWQENPIVVASHMALLGVITALFTASMWSVSLQGVLSTDSATIMVYSIIDDVVTDFWHIHQTATTIPPAQIIAQPHTIQDNVMVITSLATSQATSQATCSDTLPATSSVAALIQVQDHEAKGNDLNLFTIAFGLYAMFSFIQTIYHNFRRNNDDDADNDDDDIQHPVQAETPSLSVERSEPNKTSGMHNILHNAYEVIESLTDLLASDRSVAADSLAQAAQERSSQQAEVLEAHEAEQRAVTALAKAEERVQELQNNLSKEKSDRISLGRKHRELGFENNKIRSELKAAKVQASKAVQKALDLEAEAESVRLEKSEQVTKISEARSKSDKDVSNLEARLAAKETELSVSNKTLDSVKAVMNSLRESLAQKEKSCAEKDAAMDSLDIQAAHQLQSLQDQHEQQMSAGRIEVERMIAGRDAEISSLRGQLADRDGGITSLRRQLGEKDAEITSLRRQLAERDAELVSSQASPALQPSHPDDTIVYPTRDLVHSLGRKGDLFEGLFNSAAQPQPAVENPFMAMSHTGRVTTMSDSVSCADGKKDTAATINAATGSSATITGPAFAFGQQSPPDSGPANTQSASTMAPDTQPESFTFGKNATTGSTTAFGEASFVFGDQRSASSKPLATQPESFTFGKNATTGTTPAFGEAPFVFGDQSSASTMATSGGYRAGLIGGMVTCVEKVSGTENLLTVNSEEQIKDRKKAAPKSRKTKG